MHELYRKKGSGSIARAQNDVSIGEVYATRVSAVVFGGQSSVSKVILHLGTSTSTVD